MGVGVDLVVLLNAFLQQGTLVEVVTFVLPFVICQVISSFVFEHDGFVVAFEGIIDHQIDVKEALLEGFRNFLFHNLSRWFADMVLNVFVDDCVLWLIVIIRLWNMLLRFYLIMLLILRI